MGIIGHYSLDRELLSKLTAEHRIVFLQWFVELNKANKDSEMFYSGQRLELATGIACWFEYFQSGFTPQMALNEDLLHGL